ncbi:hypothetical protein VTL71DRAFT_11388 [Oculimacula yallundae]|uniref:Uncharacterized protein n=1 Tax=Oculimacula yallundae TaxID=86028 RepID=A0ABR4CQ39_9HELO
MQLPFSTLLLPVPFLALLPSTYARTPTQWPSFLAPSTKLSSTKLRSRSQSMFVSSGAIAPHIADIIGTCKTQQGGIVPKEECVYSVLATGVCMGLSVLAYQTPTYWAGAFGPNGNNKRSSSIPDSSLSSAAVAAVDEFFSLLPDHLSISSIRINGAALPASLESRSLHRRKETEEEYRVFYDGALPLTFMVHHEMKMGGSGGSESRSESESEINREELNDTINHTIPLFAATDGTTLYLAHIQPIPVPPNTSPIHPRSGYNGYNHIGTGGILLLGNSDPVSTWSETMSWLNGRTEANGLRPYDYLLATASAGDFLGHSFVENVRVDGKGEKGFNGQWGMVGEVHVRILTQLGKRFQLVFWRLSNELLK